MTMKNDIDQFDEYFAELMADHTPKAAVVEALAEGLVEFATTPEVVVAEDIPAVPEAAKETEKARAKYQAIPADQKTVVDGAPCITTVYPAGYVQLLWPNSKFRNACSLYLDQVEGLEKFFQSEAYKAWKAASVAAGLRTRSK
jgi:hypothetical protein